MADTKADQPRDRGLNPFGPPDASVWDKAPTPNTRKPDVAGDNSTFGSRGKAASKVKAVKSSQAEDKAVKSSTSK